jgi:hypothetical protein
MHPDGGRPVNPYPILQAASDRYQNGLRPDPPGTNHIRPGGLPNGSTIDELGADPAVTAEPAASDPARVEGALSTAVAPADLAAVGSTAGRLPSS